MTFSRPSPTEQRERRAAEREASMRLLMVPSRVLVPGTYAGASSGLAVPKGEVAKPGKRAPTVEERRWMNFIVVFGCIACRMDGVAPRPTCVHHILRGGRRMGHLHTLGLCDPGHHQGGEPLGLISRHPWRARFEAKYGTEEELLARLRAEYGATHDTR